MYLIPLHPSAIFRAGQLTNQYTLLSCCISYTNWENNDWSSYENDMIRGRARSNMLFTIEYDVWYLYNSEQIVNLKIDILDGYRITNSVYEYYLKLQENTHSSISHHLHDDYFILNGNETTEDIAEEETIEG
jgi:hypothetical protein